MDWGWERSFRFNHETGVVVGLDIGLSAVKMIRLRKNDKMYSVTACGIAKIPINDGNHGRNNLGTVRAIQECLELSGVKTKLAVLGISGPEVVVRDFEFPSIPAEEIEGAVMLEASQVCPFNIANSTVDYHLITNGDEHIGGILVAATNALISSKTRLAKEASLNCALIDVDGLSLLNCFNELKKPDAGEATAILNVGGSYTTFAIMGDNGWPFIRDMIYVGDDIIKQIASERNLPIKSVRQILSGDSETKQSELYESLEKANKKLVVDVTETLRYYNAQRKSAPPEKIFVCGDFALVEGFVELLSNQLPVEAFLWNPFDTIRCETGRSHRGVLQKNILQKSGPAMAVAAGLAMRSI